MKQNFKIPDFEKEARFGAATRGLKNAGSALRRATQDPKVPFSSGGTLSGLSPADAATQMAGKQKKFRTGSIFVDGGLGGVKKTFPRSKDKIESGVKATTNLFKNTDSKLGAMARGTNEGSKRYNLFTRKVNVPRATVTQGGKSNTLTQQIGQPSLVATPEKVSKGVAPLLGSMYLAEKFFPQEEENLETGQQPLNDEEQEFDSRTASPNDFYSEFDKTASFQKIAVLEHEIEKQASKIEYLEMEKVAIEKQFEQESKQKREFQKKASELNETLIEKNADFDELRYRLIAQERSKSAVDLSESLLESGIIKQAELEETVDTLMSADEKTFKMYESMLKAAGDKEESVESLSFLSEYNNNDKLASSAFASPGTTKTGQTIGEAANELNLK